jgi:hypothetical protein
MSNNKVLYKMQGTRHRNRCKETWRSTESKKQNEYRLAKKNKQIYK